MSEGMNVFCYYTQKLRAADTQRAGREEGEGRLWVVMAHWTMCLRPRQE